MKSVESDHQTELRPDQFVEKWRKVKKGGPEHRVLANRILLQDLLISNTPKDDPRFTTLEMIESREALINPEYTRIDRAILHDMDLVRAFIMEKGNVISEEADKRLGDVLHRLNNEITEKK